MFMGKETYLYCFIIVSTSFYILGVMSATQHGLYSLEKTVNSFQGNFYMITTDNLR